VLRSAAACLLLIVLQLVLLDGFWNHLDLHAYDGVDYLQRGIGMAAGHLSPGWLAWAPVLSALHALLHLLGVPVAHSQDATTVLVSVGCTGALFFLLRPLIGFVPALLAVALWTASPLALHCATGVGNQPGSPN
jgi:hypothetical protein